MRNIAVGRNFPRVSLCENFCRLFVLSRTEWLLSRPERRPVCSLLIIFYHVHPFAAIFVRVFAGWFKNPGERISHDSPWGEPSSGARS